MNIDVYTNYNVYRVAKQSSHEIDRERLERIIERCKEKYTEKPYIRFMWVASAEEAMCVLYNGKERATKLIPISELEKQIDL